MTNKTQVAKMSNRPLRPCAIPLCPNLTRERYCEQHAYRKKQDEAERQRFYDQHQRDRKAAEFYRTSEWQRLAERRLALDHYLCRNCLAEQKLTRATEVDHVIPIRVRWDLRLELSNTRSLCHRCHMRKTAEDRRRYESDGVGEGQKFPERLL